MTELVPLILYSVGTLAGSFFCSLSEAALLASSEARIRSRVEDGLRGASRLLKLRRDPGRTLASIVFLNNVFAIGGTGLITASATSMIGSGGALFLFICVWTFLIIAFGEIVPKVLGEALPEPIAQRVTPVLIWVRRLLAPFVRIVEVVVSWARPKARVKLGDESEIRELARLGHEEGHIDAEEAELIRRIFRLDDITAEDVMTPRALVNAFSQDQTLDEVRMELMAANHSQFPVYEGDLDKVVGVLPVSLALRHLVRGEGHVQVGALKLPALFLPVSKTVDDVLRDIQAAHGRMAIVIDEYGVTEGIITMDDLVEELVGEAIDDTDVSEGLVKRLTRRAALVHGLSRVRDVARFLNCPGAGDTPEEEHNTVTGLLQERLGRIPRVGDRVELEGGLRFVVREADDRSVQRVFAKNILAEEEEESAEGNEAPGG
jgi:CBS domain containing-hemolysin-like protein